jgi:hypothetical protein
VAAFALVALGLGPAVRLAPARDGRLGDRVAAAVGLGVALAAGDGATVLLRPVVGPPLPDGLGVAGVPLAVSTAPSRFTPTTPPTSTAATTAAVATGPREDLRVRLAVCLPVKTDLP